MLPETSDVQQFIQRYHLVSSVFSKNLHTLSDLSMSTNPNTVHCLSQFNLICNILYNTFLFCKIQWSKFCKIFAHSSAK